MPEWVIPVVMIAIRIIERLRDWRRPHAPPWQEPSQWALVVMLLLLLVMLMLPKDPQWVRRMIQFVVFVLVVVAAIGAGAFDLIWR